MQKVILLTGATDGIGYETAKVLVAEGHQVLLHGRSPAKLEKVAGELSAAGGKVETYVADLSSMADVEALAKAVSDNHQHLDVLINNAGVYNTPVVETEAGLDIRFAVNTIAPYLLTKLLMPLFDTTSRVVNLSSAAQAPVDLNALTSREVKLSDSAAYAQSKLALTMWSRQLGLAHKEQGPLIVSVNPASLLGSKMVKSAYGIAGGDLSIGADILHRAALSSEFDGKHGMYFDNDNGRFADPHPTAMNPATTAKVVNAIDEWLAANA